MLSKIVTAAHEVYLADRIPFSSSAATGGEVYHRAKLPETSSCRGCKHYREKGSASIYVPCNRRIREHGLSLPEAYVPGCMCKGYRRLTTNRLTNTFLWEPSDELKGSPVYQNIERHLNLDWWDAAGLTCNPVELVEGYTAEQASPYSLGTPAPVSPVKSHMARLAEAKIKMDKAEKEYLALQEEYNTLLREGFKDRASEPIKPTSE